MRGFLPFEGHIHKVNGLQSQHLTSREREVYIEKRQGGGEGVMEGRKKLKYTGVGVGVGGGEFSPFCNNFIDSSGFCYILPGRGFLLRGERERLPRCAPRCEKPVEADFSFRLSCLPNDFCFTAQLDCVH